MKTKVCYQPRRSACPRFSWWLLSVSLVPACDTTMPSEKFRREVRLPIPRSTSDIPSSDRLSHEDRGEFHRLTPLSLIILSFNQQPDIKSSFERFKSEESRYDFFVVSRDSLTPRLRTTNSFNENRADKNVARARDHVVELSIEKRYFDTTELNIGTGLRIGAEDEAIGYQPFLSANLRYPLWVSRQKLERTSEEIFRRNELNDAQLDYIQLVRRRLQNSLFRFYEVLDLHRQVANHSRWRQDLLALLTRLDSIVGRDLVSDRERIKAELASVQAQLRERQGRLDIQRERLKSACGLPFHAKIELVDQPFNPFEGSTHDELLRLSIETDPEIATLRNEQKNAEVQLDLAKRGQWDVTLSLDGIAGLEGAGESEGVSDWSMSMGIDISAVDPRVTSSLMSQAQARIARFQQAIVARENAIFVDTFEPIVRIETISTSRDELITNHPKYVEDYNIGLQDYEAGTLNIDDLLKRRESLFDQEQDISRFTFLVGANVAELCAATGKFFELIEQGDDAHLDGG